MIAFLLTPAKNPLIAFNKSTPRPHLTLCYPLPQALPLHQHFLNLRRTSFVCISESQDASCWGCNANSTFFPTVLNWKHGASLKKSDERTHGGRWRRSSYSFYVSWNCRSLHNEHCWRRWAYVILFRLRRQLYSTFRGCFPCVVYTVHPTLLSSALFYW